MPRNVEIKARIRDLTALEIRVRELARRDGGAEEPEVLHPGRASQAARDRARG